MKTEKRGGGAGGSAALDYCFQIGAVLANNGKKTFFSCLFSNFRSYMILPDSILYKAILSRRRDSTRVENDMCGSLRATHIRKGRARYRRMLKI